MYGPGEGRGARGAAAPPPKKKTKKQKKKNKATETFWVAIEIWAKPVFKDVFKLFLPEVGIVKPVKFRQEKC